MNFEEELNKRFEEQSKAIEGMESEGPEVFGHKLKDQQRLTVLELSKRDSFLNYSGTGAGKTKAAIAAAYYLGLKHTIIFCPHSVINTAWLPQIKEAKFTKTVVENEIITEYGDEFTFEVFNYDKFNTLGQADERLKKILNSKKYDFIVFDEAHRLKNKESNTYCSILKFTQTIRKLNPNLKILGCTATPTTTSNKDLQGIHEIMSGKKADELTTGSLASQLINTNKILETSGFGYFPKSKLNTRYNGINSEELFVPKERGKAIFKTELANIDGTSIEKECIMHRGNISKIEELHLPLKFNAYKHLIKKGTVIYTEYTYGDKMLFELKDLVEDTLHLTACIYSGENKDSDFTNEHTETKKRTSLTDFIERKKDVLIGTKSMCEGVDGIQKVSNRLILHTIPAVWSVMHQLNGRFDREGSIFIEEGVDVFVPMVVFQLPDGSVTSFDRKRWDMAMRRKIKDDITKGGHLEEITFAKKKQLIDEVIAKLKDKYELTEIERENIEASEFDDTPIEWKKRESFVSNYNNKGRKTGHLNLYKKITENPKEQEEWDKYQDARSKCMEDWDEIPYEYIAKKYIKNKNRVVGDFGCGMNLMKTFIPENKVYSFDVRAYNGDPTVTVCDMAHTGLEDSILDIAVFSLSISWGNGCEEYFKEAYRLLNYGGMMHIAEPLKKYPKEKRDELLNMLKKNGFTQVGDIKYRNKFFYVNVMKM